MRRSRRAACRSVRWMLTMQSRDSKEPLHCGGDAEYPRGPAALQPVFRVGDQHGRRYGRGGGNPKKGKNDDPHSRPRCRSGIRAVICAGPRAKKAAGLHPNSSRA